jgi:Rrf2 family protein
LLGVSRHTDYAARIVLHLAALGPSGKATIRDIAAHKRLPVPFIRRIVAQLVEQEILVTVRGTRGGIHLARPAKEISLLDLVQAMEGPIAVSPCVGTDDTCPFSGQCPVQVAWRDVGSDLSRSLSAVTFDKLVSGSRGHQVAHRLLDPKTLTPKLRKRPT